MIFRPLESNGITMSPDGRYLAYTERRGDELDLVIRDVSANTVKRAFLAQAEAVGNGVHGRTPARLTFMRWAAGDRLVFNLNRENVWCVTMDGEAHRLADARTFAPPPPDPQYKVVGTDSGGGSDGGPPAVIVIAPNALMAAAAMDQPLEVSAMSRGDRFVFVEALMKSRGVSIEERDIGGSAYYAQSRIAGATPRVVLRFDVVTGKDTEWAEAPESSSLICDQSGYPRVILQRENLLQSNGLRQAFLYAPAKSSDWLPLDTRLGETPLNFRTSPTDILAERSVPLGFDYDGTTLYYASNVGHDTYGVYALDTRTWQRTNLAVESKTADLFDPLGEEPASDRLVFDPWRKKLVGVRYVAALRTTLWFDPELRVVQHTLDTLDATKQWQILEWNEARTTFLVAAGGLSDPGVYCLYYPAEKQVVEVMSRAPWMTDEGRNAAAAVSIRRKDGSALSGYVTFPRHARIKRPPVVVLCHDGPWGRDTADYDPEAQALASMGFIVLQVNYRGSAGFGRRYLEALRDDDQPAIDDICAAVDSITAKQGDRRLVAIMGHGYGGYLALRALQRHPQMFRCAIALDAPVDLPTWVNARDRFTNEQRTAYFGSDTAKLSAISPLAHADQVQVPVLLLESDTNGAAREGDLAAKLHRLNRDATYVRLSRDESQDLPEARAALFHRINDFLNVNIYHYAVQLGLAVEVPNPEPPRLPPPPRVAPILPPK